MSIFKKIVIDILFGFLFFLIALILATALKMQNPECATCGANISITIWWASMIALQPVLWTTGIKKKHRFLIWLIAVLIGGITYVILEIAGGILLSSGKTFGLSLGFYANSVFYLVSLIISLLGVRFTKRKSKNQSPTEETENPEVLEIFNQFVNEQEKKPVIQVIPPVNHSKTAIKKSNKISKFFKHISNIKALLLYPFVPFVLIMAAFYVFDQEKFMVFDRQKFMWAIKHDLDDVVGVFFAIYLITFGILLFLNIIYRIVLNWGGNYIVRLWVFGVIVWMLGSLGVMWIVNYYEYNSFISMIKISYPYISLIIFFPPLFVGSALFVYNKYIKTR
jgi:MFS family permease